MEEAWWINNLKKVHFKMRTKWQKQLELERTDRYSERVPKSGPATEKDLVSGLTKERQSDDLI